MLQLAVFHWLLTFEMCNLIQRVDIRFVAISQQISYYLRCIFPSIMLTSPLKHISKNCLRIKYKDVQTKTEQFSIEVLQKKTKQFNKYIYSYFMYSESIGLPFLQWCV
jgi:hypothetical protein